MNVTWLKDRAPGRWCSIRRRRIPGAQRPSSTKATFKEPGEYVVRVKADAFGYSGLGREPMLLDQRLPEGHGDAIAARRRRMVVVALLLGASALAHAQDADRGAARRVAAFERDYPELNGLLIGVERAHGVLYGAIARGRGKVREAETFRLMTRRSATAAVASAPDPESDAGYARLGPRGAEVIRRAQAFHREALAILATVDKAERVRGLDDAVDRYLSRPAVALPDVPKDMTILYDHPYTSMWSTSRARRGGRPRG